MGIHLGRPRRWRAVAASVAGTSHVEAGQACADACAVRELPGRRGGPLLVAVAADGAGSAGRGAEGARVACTAVIERAARLAARSGRDGPEGRGGRRFDREEALGWVDVARRAVQRAAAAEDGDVREFACTLLVALVDRRAGAFVQVGDGAMVYGTPGGGYVPAIWPRSGEYANSTHFLTDEDVVDRVAWASAADVDEVALLTDGLQALALRLGTREAHGPFFEPMFARLRGERRPERLEGPLRAFLASPEVNRRTDDDKTLVLATRLPGGRLLAGAGR